jgi:hypothetical protein
MTWATSTDWLAMTQLTRHQNIAVRTVEKAGASALV